MRGLRSTAALLVVLIGLGAYIYFVTWRREDPALSREDRVYRTLDGDDITEFTIKAGSDVTTVRKQGESWQIVSPVTFPASPTQVQGLTSMLGYIDIVRVIDEDPKDLNEYGLANPRVSIEFKIPGETQLGALLIGNKSPTGDNIYAKRADEKRVVLIGSHQESSLSRTTFDLREKKIVEFRREQVDGLEIKMGRQHLAFKKNGSQWIMVSPMTARAEFAAVDDLIGSIEVAQMRSVVSDEATPADMKSYGLDPPEVSVDVNVGGTRTTLLVGKLATEDSFYAKDPAKPAIITVEKILSDGLRKPVDDFRRKDVFEFRSFTATRVELTKGGQSAVFELVKGTGDKPQDSWRRVSPNPGEVDKARFDSLLTGLTDMRATGFVPATASTGLRTPALTVAVKFDEGAKEERVTFGRSGKDAYASRPDEPGALKIEPEMLDKAIEALDQLSK
jgi:hypothetical protein